jgi:queuine/archaeosine tRNA-ribosyltransferase
VAHGHDGVDIFDCFCDSKTQRDENVTKTQGTNVLVETGLRGTAGQGEDSQWRSLVRASILITEHI